jgi:AbiV family abortive infection protein
VKPLSINQILSASSKIIENAQELIEEAELLLKNNKNARAFALAHLACEELIKFNLLFPIAFELARDHNIDWKGTDTRLNNHLVKIRGAIFLDFIRKLPEGGVYQAEELSQQMSTSKKLNDMKNYSLYASQVGHDYVKPSELIDNQAAMERVSYARKLLQVYSMSYSAIFALTGMTEEGLRRSIEMPEFQALFQLLGSITDLSDLSQVDKQLSITEIITFFNNPTLQPLLAQIFSTMEQDLQLLNQTQNQKHQDKPEKP